MIGASTLLVVGCARLGSIQLRLLLGKEGMRTGFKSPLARETEGNSNHMERSRTMRIVRVAYQGHKSMAYKLSDTPARSVPRIQEPHQQEAVQLLLLGLIGLSVIVSLVALAVVDQGLMSYRLMAFTGAIVGTATAAWNTHAAKFQLPAWMTIDALPEREGLPTTERPEIGSIIRVTGAL
jgi:hypothetical protein